MPSERKRRGQVGVWDFKEEEDNSQGDRKQMFGKQLFVIRCRDNGTQRLISKPCQGFFPTTPSPYSL